MQPNGGMQPLYTPFNHQIYPNASTAPQLPQQPNMLPPPQFPYHHHLGNMGGPSLIPQSNPLVFPQNNVMGVGHMFPPNGQFCNLQTQPPHMFPPHPQTLMNQNPQLGLPFFGNPYFGAFGQANPSMPINSGPPQQQQQLLQSWSQPQSQAQSQQGNSAEFNQGNVSNTGWKSGPGQNFSRNQKRGFQKKTQFHHGNNGHRNSGFQHQQHKKGYGNERAAKIGQSNQMNPPKEKKRSFALIYTDEEVRKWREERRRNYPTKAFKEMKLSETQTSSQAVDREAKIRREQLKEILAKQAELGVEVAEIPSHYLSDAEMQSHRNERKENTRLNKRGRFQNRNDKRGRRNRKDAANKKQKLQEKDSSSNHASGKKKPTLLQKLLSKDIKKDQSSLLQVFRFITMNSFFKDLHKKPLKFPSVIVKESGVTEELTEDKALIVGKDASQESSRMVAEIGDDVDKDDENDDEKLMKENSHGDRDGGRNDDVSSSSHEEEEEEEEGEIID